MKIHFVLLCALLISLCSYAGNYTWNGSTSGDWHTSTNWTPNGVPTDQDTVTIVSAGNNTQLGSSAEVKKFTITSGVLELHSGLKINGPASFTSGEIVGSTITILGTSTITFTGTEFSCKVNAKGNSILLNGSIFNDSLKVEKVGDGSDNGKGGNTYNGYVDIINNSGGALVLSDSFPDIFNGDVRVHNSGGANTYIAHRGIGCEFHGLVTFSGAKSIYSNYYGQANYYGGLIINMSGSAYFGFGNGSCTLSDTSNLDVQAISGTGALYFRNFNQLKSGDAIVIGNSGETDPTFPE